jgi:hypothetical protein
MKVGVNKLENAALRFHKDNPLVWDLFVRFTNEVIARGFKNYSSYAIFERIRWETDIVTASSDDSFKINNNHRPYYPRWYMEAYPEHNGFFRIRKLHAAQEVDDYE